MVTRFCHFFAKWKCPSLVIIVRDLLNSVVPEDMISSPVNEKSNWKGGLQMFQVHRLIGYNFHDLKVMAVLSSAEPIRQVFIVKGFSSLIV